MILIQKKILFGKFCLHSVDIIKDQLKSKTYLAKKFSKKSF